MPQTYVRAGRSYTDRTGDKGVEQISKARFHISQNFRFVHRNSKKKSTYELRCISAVPTGRIFVKFGTGNFYENPSINSKFSLNRTKVSGTLRQDLNTFTLLTAVRNMVYLDNSAKRNYSVISMTTICFMLVTAIFRSTTKKEHIVAFP